ncbi:MAG: hypothetical protein ACYDCQ_08355 [Dehalococcoidia bacterium]
MIRAWQSGDYTLILSDHVIAELARTLANPYFRQRVTPSQADRVLALL